MSYGQPMFRLSRPVCRIFCELSVSSPLRLGSYSYSGFYTENYSKNTFIVTRVMQHGDHVLVLLNATCQDHRKRIYFYGTCTDRT